MERIQVLHGSDGKWHLFDKWAGEACDHAPYRSKAQAEAAKAQMLDSLAAAADESAYEAAHNL